MVTAESGMIFEFQGQLVQCIGIIDLRALCLIQIREEDFPKCPGCGHRQGPEHFAIIESSPLFQEGAKPVKTIQVEDKQCKL